MPRNCERRGVKDLENIFIDRIRLRMQKKLGKVRSIVCINLYDNSLRIVVTFSIGKIFQTFDNEK